MNLEKTDTGVLNDFRRAQLQSQVVNHTDKQLPPLTNISKAEELIKAGKNSPLTTDDQLNSPSFRTIDTNTNSQSMLEGPKKDNKFADILSKEPQKVQPLTKNLKNGIEDPNASQTKPLPKR